MEETSTNQQSSWTGAHVYLLATACLVVGLAIAVVKALADSAWGTFTVGATIPIAMFIGWYMFRFRKGKITEGSIIGVTLVRAVVRRDFPPAGTSTTK